MLLKWFCSNKILCSCCNHKRIFFFFSNGRKWCPTKLQYIDLHLIFLDIQEFKTYEIMSSPISIMTKNQMVLPNFDPMQFLEKW